MRDNIKNEFLASPLFIITLSYSLFIVSLFIPADYYERIIGERNLLFIDPESFIFVTVNVVSFYLGCLFYNMCSKKFRGTGLVNKGIARRVPVSIFSYIFLPVLLFLLASLFS
ncbi:hypothetical protein, partial [Raoultella planticola]